MNTFKFAAMNKASVLFINGSATEIAIIDSDPRAVSNPAFTSTFKVINRTTNAILFEGAYSLARKFALAMFR